MDFSHIDELVFESINHLAISISALNPVMQFLSEKAEYLFYLGIILYWFTREQKNKKMVIVALFSACIGFGIGKILSHFFYRDRPFVHHAVNQLIEHAANASFPSDHSIGSFVIATAIFLFRKREGIIWLLLAGLISFSRIWNGVHFPSDVIAGALIGIFTSVLVYQLIRRWSFAQKCLNSCVDFYENIERKIGLRRSKDQSTHLDQ
ncbi:hypothetical protein BVG16_21670 [Paenibacillus selenitireducens]|uniref:Phosphatidic acid phosphatase type 2/haloperoxidase domain-containing protein n=1 Tax=Paenibacillus selenitireducens TaxID=1324314 RepID=A0A1T2X5Q8_9BACL|nr:undecaprenyl-diphosphatase [Paenibacillus selenitireducens]OPA75214.1 hypothetical protein BVG16_21670 [Paenibacillus selenitireducens]